MSVELKEIKRWTLLKNVFDNSDYIWLKNNSDSVHVNVKKKEIGFGNIPNYFYEETEVIIQTSSTEQESMLLLKYGSQLLLLTVVFLEQGQMYQDHYGTIICNT